MENFFDATLEDSLKLHPSALHGSYRTELENILRKRYEGVCSRFGFVRHGSIELQKVRSGNVELHTFHGFVIFDVVFRASICNPSVGSVLRADVVNMNSFGVLCAPGYVDAERTRNVIDIIIPRQVTNMLENTTALLNNLKIGDSINVEIIGKKYQLRHNRISTIGQMVEKLPTSTVELFDNVSCAVLDEVEGESEEEPGMGYMDSESEESEEGSDAESQLDQSELFVPDEVEPKEDDSDSDLY